MVAYVDVEKVSTVIVGAGVCGLKAASRLMLDGNDDFVLLEKAAGIGGVCASLYPHCYYTVLHTALLQQSSSSIQL